MPGHHLVALWEAHDQLKPFYKYHFIGANPADTAMKLISRTVGENSLVVSGATNLTPTMKMNDRARCSLETQQSIVFHGTVRYFL